MDNYTKGKNVDEPLDRNAIPIPNISDNFLWMQVNGGSKLRALLGHAMGVIADGGARSVVWSGSGAGVPRAISCAEVMKKETKMPHQITKVAYRKSEEFWEPQMEGLERLVVNREVPIVHILLSFDQLDTSEPGYQCLNSTNTFWQSTTVERKKFDKRKKSPKVSYDEVASMGLQSERRGKKILQPRPKKNVVTEK